MASDSSFQLSDLPPPTHHRMDADTDTDADAEHPSLASDSDYHALLRSQRLGRPARGATRSWNVSLNSIGQACRRLVLHVVRRDEGQNRSNSPAHRLLGDDGEHLSFGQSLKYIFFSSSINYLTVFAPVGIATYYLQSPYSVVFASNAIAIVPLSNILAHATECIAADLGDAVGALMNITFGNLVEIIMFLAAIRYGHLRVVKSALVGSILVNLLLILGTSIIAAEFHPADLVYDMNNAQALACLLSLSVFTIMIPMAFHFTFKHEEEREYAVRTLSRASAIILLIVYFVYLTFLLLPRRRGAVLTDGEEVEAADDDEQQDLEAGNSEPYIGSEMEISQTFAPPQSREEQSPRPGPRTIKFADEPSALSLSRPSLQENGDANLWEYQEDHPPQSNHAKLSSHPVNHDKVQRWMKGGSGAPRSRGAYSRHTRSLSQSSFGTTRSLRANDIVERYADGGGPTSTRSYSPFHVVEPNNDLVTGEPNAKVSRMASITALTLSTLVTAICAEFLVDTIGEVIKSSGLTQSFIGLIILSVVGNAAEYITGVRVAARGKLDLAIGVAFGSSIQIALFVSPLTVICGWAMGKNMTLYLGLFETTVLVGAAILVNFLMTNGRTNYLEGTLLCASYVITGIGSYLMP
ncbi:hypothetical protein F4777DRAFT_601188 [Nemania sp. FL0916]|nr:hypothetical protein F4777DRAFT_601188 [Nemania sp. FL0916]